MLGHHYLMMIKPLLDEMQASGLSYEVDKSKMKAGEDLATNMGNLTSACQRMLDTILGSVNQCPLPFRVCLPAWASKMLSLLVLV